MPAGTEDIFHDFEKQAGGRVGDLSGGENLEFGNVEFFQVLVEPFRAMEEFVFCEQTMHDQRSIRLHKLLEKYRCRRDVSLALLCHFITLTSSANWIPVCSFSYFSRVEYRGEVCEAQGMGLQKGKAAMSSYHPLQFALKIVNRAGYLVVLTRWLLDGRRAGWGVQFLRV
jgi:hypothetical protein